MSWLEKLSDAKVLAVAKLVVDDFPDDQLRAAIEQLDKDGHIVSDITRYHLAEAIDEFSLAGKRDLIDLLRKHWPAIDQISSICDPFETLVDDIFATSCGMTIGRIPTFSNGSASYMLPSQAVRVSRRRGAPGSSRHRSARGSSPNSTRYSAATAISWLHRRMSGYPTYRVQETTATGFQPADELISAVLRSFDESGVHAAWKGT